eukprot:6333093-Amphidinium_carterae.2
MSSKYIEHWTLISCDGAANIKMAFASNVLSGQPWGHPLVARYSAPAVVGPNLFLVLEAT